ncbi:hypothetical protein HDU79_009734 [Rhizoclosmatium sp. JEL0117]|nr:hypothetical protein HDU79_009734 [Rhizoclosmatium sp. JEL0117]
MFPSVFLVFAFIRLCYAVDSKIVVAYLPSWGSYSASQIDFSIVTHVHYSFATLTENDVFILPEGPNLVDVVETVHKGGAKITLAIGGATGSASFHNALSTPDKISAAVNEISSHVWQYRLDGIDIDWEFPVDPADHDNFYAFLKQLRQSLGDSFLISACVGINAFAGSDGAPSKDVSDFANVLSFIFIMAYDMNGSWADVTGPNAPFKDSTANNVWQSVENWHQAKFPYEKLVLGVPFYGMGLKVLDSMANNDATNQQGTIDKSATESSYDYTQILTILGGRQYKYDTATQTPWAYIEESQEYVSFDDPTSIAYKVNYAACTGLLGVGMWDITKDGGKLLPSLKGIHSCDQSQNFETSSNQAVPNQITATYSRCGGGWDDANSNCYSRCNNDADCPNSLRCYKDLNVGVCSNLFNRDIRDILEPKIVGAESAYGF